MCERETKLCADLLKIILVLGFLFSTNLPQISSQHPQRLSSGQIYQSIQKLNTVASVLYIAAHPDDENTRLISYFSNEMHYRTAYLSLTRGDGGQNLVGPEIRELLGVIRTQELLQARNLDGGIQFFTRANDFGYSKHPDETLRIWNHEEVLSDVVWAIRKFKPDIIVNRFDHRSPGRTHGHHTSSAMLSIEAFDLCNDKSAFSDQLQFITPWQPSRLFFNTSWWFYGSRENFENADKSTMMSVDVGSYYPLLALSNNEIAAMSRSMHKSQGFGTSGTRGSQMEYLELLKGSMPDTKTNVTEGIDISWSRIKGGKDIGKDISHILDNFDFVSPQSHIGELLEIREKIKLLEDDHWRPIKLAEIESIIEACAGFYFEGVADEYILSEGDKFELTLEMIVRSDVPVLVRSIKSALLEIDTSLNLELSTNTVTKWNQSLHLPKVPYTNSYWLNEPYELGMYTVDKQTLRGVPETPRGLNVEFTLQLDGEFELTLVKPVVYKRSDPVKGEVYRPLEIVPPVSMNFGESVFIFSSDEAASVELDTRSLSDEFSGTVSLNVPDGWEYSPQNFQLSFTEKGQNKLISFEVTPPPYESDGEITAIIKNGDESYAFSKYDIEYDHIPTRTVFLPSQAKLVKLDLRVGDDNVAYIMGAGDDIPKALRQIGYEVTELEPSELQQTDFSRFDAVITGVRAYNTVNELRFANHALLDYVENGGVLLVQYNTSFRLVTQDIGPYPLKYGRGRVADELAEIRIIEPEHPVLHHPNPIAKTDFDGWVQERGLYFPDEWDDKYIAILSSNDVGEDPRDSGLLIAPYGDGHFIYTGYSWFRQLPAGVSGAFKLFVNMISLQNTR